MKCLAVLVLCLLCSVPMGAEGREWAIGPASASTSLPQAAKGVAFGANMSPLTSANDNAVTNGGPAEAYLAFDLGPILQSDDHIDIVYLEWPLDGIRPDTLSTFFIYGVSDSAASILGSSVPHTNDEDLVDVWDFSPWDYERLGGFVLFDISALAKEWLNGQRSNAGVVIKTYDLDNATLQNQLMGARLVLR